MDENTCICPSYPSAMSLKSELTEFSVVYTDRALNLMSSPFQQVMRDLSENLKKAYNASSTIIVPGSGSYAMEAVARQFATGKSVVVIRNGYFSFRWSDIFDQGHIPSAEKVLMARATSDEKNPTFAPPPLEEVLKAIAEEKPQAVFAPQVETSTGIILPIEYIKAVSKAVHDVGGVFVLDSIAAGCMWIDQEETGVDILISAPQKGWSGPACCGIVMLNKNGKEALAKSEATSLVLNLKKWAEVMEKYENGGFMYYTTLPTDALALFRDSAVETAKFGFEAIQERSIELGTKVRIELEKRGYKSVAAEGFKSPTVVVSYSDDPGMVARFKEQGTQIAGGVPFKINEPEGLITFRIGLFGLDKVKDVDACVAGLVATLDAIDAAKL